MRALGTSALVITLTLAAAGPAAAADPTNLTATVSGQIVVLRWQGDGSTWIVEAGTGPGLTNIAVAPIVTATRLFSVANVPPGVYYVRIRGVAGGVPTGPSNEVVFEVHCTIGELDLRSFKSGLQVQFNWSVFGVVPGVQLEVGSAPGVTDLVLLPLPTFPTQLNAQGPPGTYFVRLRGRSGCGVGDASNEVRIDLGSASHCQPTLSPANRTVTFSGTYSVSISVPAGCAWTVFTRDTGWITPLTLNGVGSGTIFYRVTLPGGGTGQIFVTTSSGRYFVSVTS